MLGLLPETETCAGWDSKMQILYEKSIRRGNHAHLLADYRMIYANGMQSSRQPLLTKKKGWNAELKDDD
jgi:hypothetical protein